MQSHIGYHLLFVSSPIYEPQLHVFIWFYLFSQEQEIAKLNEALRNKVTESDGLSAQIEDFQVGIAYHSSIYLIVCNIDISQLLDSITKSSGNGANFGEKERSIDAADSAVGGRGKGKGNEDSGAAVRE